MQEINTHNLLVLFGKHKGEYWTRVPANYLRWLVNQPDEIPGFAENKKIAQAELNRRGTVLSAEVEVSPHAIDTASLRVRKIWHETKKDPGEGLYSWLSRVSTEAVETLKNNEKPDRVDYLGITFVFKWGNVFPILKTVLVKHKLRGNKFDQIIVDELTELPEEATDASEEK